MPKILVLFQAHARVAPLVEAAAEGVRSVRFAEVDVRRMDDGADAEPASARHRVLGDAHELSSYDAIILGAAGYEGAATMTQALLQGGPASDAKALVNKVGAAFAPEGTPWPLVQRMGEVGMILVAPALDGSGADAMLAAVRQLGHRVAHVAGWVSHARSHHHH